MKLNGVLPNLARRVLRCAFALALPAALLTGCIGYRLGSTLPRELRTIQVPAFVNRTGEPLLEAETTSAVIRELQQDGTLRVVQAGEDSDLVLNVVLASYELEPVRYTRDDTQTAQEYRLRIEAEVECVRRSNGETIASGLVHGEATFVPTGGLASSKHAALPDAARDLAYRVVQSVVQAW